MRHLPPGNQKSIVSDPTIRRAVSDKTITRVCINDGSRRSGPRRLNPVRSQVAVRRAPLAVARMFRWFREGSLRAERRPPPRPTPHAAATSLSSAPQRTALGGVGRWVLIYKWKNRGRVDCTLSVTLPIPLQLNHFTTSPCVRADGPGCATQALPLVCHVCESKPICVRHAPGLEA